MTAAIERRRVQSGNLGLAVQVRARAGVSRPTIVLVHGYPDDSSVWEGVAQQLENDFNIVTYDVRGAGESDAPRRVADYRLDCLVDDLGVVIEAVSPGQPVHLVAHDWGSIQCWEAVTTDRLAGRIASFTSISGPSFDHAGFWFREAFHSPAGRRKLFAQLRRSWYMFFFQLPLLAPLGWRLVLARGWPQAMLKVEGIRIEPRAHQLRNGVNGVNLYRANFLPRLVRPRERHARIPVLLIVPRQDPYIGAALYDGLDRWVPDLLRVEVDAGHWLPLKQPDFVSRTICNWVGQLSGRAAVSGEPGL